MSAQNTKRDSWDRMFWGVLFTGGSDFPEDNRPLLIGGGWHEGMRTRPTYPGEPTHAILFRSRRQARAWCAEQHAEYKGRKDRCAKWRFRPVRVRETVTPV